MFKLFKKKEKDKKSELFDFEKAPFKMKVESLLKSISKDDDEYKERLELINQMKKWYELRYPSVYIEKFFDLDYVEDINDYVFKNTKKPDMDWNDIYNTKVFLNLLNPRLHRFLRASAFNDGIYLRVGYLREYIRLSKKGTIMCSDLFEKYEGKSIRKLYEDILNNKVYINTNSEDKEQFISNMKVEIENVINDYDNEIKAKKTMIECVIYSLLDHWNLEIASRRALLFAEEFKGNIDIPLIYGAGTTYYNDCTKDFINYYLMLGGDINLECFEDYDRKKYNKVPLKDILKKYHNSKYEKEMLERIVSILKSNIPNNVEGFEKSNEIKQKRIERKLYRK